MKNTCRGAVTRLINFEALMVHHTLASMAVHVVNFPMVPFVASTWALSRACRLSTAAVKERSCAELSLTEGCCAVDDLLRMVSGIDWNENTAMDTNGGSRVPLNDAAQMLFEAPNGAAFVGQLPQNSTPGRYWNYSTGNFQLLQYNLRCVTRLISTEVRLICTVLSVVLPPTPLNLSAMSFN